MTRLDFELTPFIGRVEERARLERALGESFLTTIVGPGGTGKTRLAIEVSKDAVERFGRVAFVDLSVTADPNVAADEIARSAEKNAGDGDALLVIDNCEHVTGAAAGSIASVLRAHRGVRVIATSREPLGLPGEVVIPLDPLALPEPSTTASAVARSEAVRLLIDRARLSDPTFDVTDGNAADVAALCRELDGLPLALELVAPYLRALAPADILQRIHTLGVRGVPTGRTPPAERHATLAATIEWSYRLLSDEERRCLTALSVFTGRFTLEAVQEIVGAVGIDRHRAVDVLVSLVDKSLVRVHRDERGNWYGLLQMIRSFAWDSIGSEEDDGTIRFERDGDLWRVGLGRRTVLLRDSKGIRYIRQLLDAPGQETAAASLVAPHGQVSSAPMEAIDDDAKAAYRRRLEELGDEIETAEMLEDEARLARATQERDALTTELSRALGLGGRIRRQGAESERARMSVTKAIRGAIEKIAEHDEELGAYLARTIRTGTYCGYFPER